MRSSKIKPQTLFGKESMATGFGHVGMFCRLQKKVLCRHFLLQQIPLSMTLIMWLFLEFTRLQWVSEFRVERERHTHFFPFVFCLVLSILTHTIQELRGERLASKRENAQKVGVCCCVTPVSSLPFTNKTTTVKSKNFTCKCYEKRVMCFDCVPHGHCMCQSTLICNASVWTVGCSIGILGALYPQH